MSIGNNIYKLRTEKKLSQGELADILEVSRQSVSKWETDAAVPEVDKLIKLCDVFEVSLDEITDRAERKKEIKTEVKTTSAQRIIGYILFAFSLLLGLLTLLLGHNEGDFLILIPLALAIMICGLLCLFSGDKAYYWCIWTVFAPVAVLSPHVVGFPIISTMTTLIVMLMIIMFFFARRAFKDKVIIPSNKKTILLTFAWLLPISWLLFHIYTLVIPLPPSFNYYSYTFSVTLNFICYILIALLETYTVCYVKGIKRK